MGSPDEFAHAAAELFRQAAQKAIAVQGRFSAALSGGTTPGRLFRRLGTSYRKKISWDRVHLFWSDERCVARDHEQSNFRLAYDELISNIWIPSENIHRVKGELSPETAAAYYESAIKKHFGQDLPAFDLILLGVGADGHAASLFPGSETLREQERIALPVFSDTALHWRVTLTLPVLNAAKQVLFLVSGRSKAEIVKALLSGQDDSTCPASMVRPAAGTLMWLLDREAVSLLEEG